MKLPLLLSLLTTAHGASTRGHALKKCPNVKVKDVCGPGCHNIDGLVITNDSDQEWRICEPAGSGYCSPKDSNERFPCDPETASKEIEQAEHRRRLQFDDIVCHNVNGVCGPGCWNIDDIVLSNGLRVCVEVGKGYYGPFHSNDRFKCPPGTASDITTAVECPECLPGSISGEGFRQCQMCTPGFYQDDFGESTCWPCTPGYEGFGATEISTDGECLKPTFAPSASPSAPAPSEAPTTSPSSAPSTTPTMAPSQEPSLAPTMAPSSYPTEESTETQENYEIDGGSLPEKSFLEKHGFLIGGIGGAVFLLILVALVIVIWKLGCGPRASESQDVRNAEAISGTATATKVSSAMDKKSTTIDKNSDGDVLVVEATLVPGGGLD